LELNKKISFKLKNALKFISLLLLLFIQGCKSDDCEDIACFTPPMPFTFDLVDKESGENLFTNGSYNSDDIEVLNVNDNSRREFRFISENELNIIQIGSIGWEDEIAEVVLKVGDIIILNLYVDSERVSENCCNFTKYNEIRIDNADYDLNNQTGIYTIYIE
jgi:hypothetical protein